MQNLADGGIVHSLTGMLGMRKRTPEEMLAADAKVQERNREAAARVAARAKPAQPAAPAEGKAVSDYAGMSAMQRREKELGLKDGGLVPRGFKPGGLIRGPGTGTSDSIQTEKRPGTFIMPADSTQAIGPEALEELGEVDDSAMEEQGEKTPVRLSNGEFELPPEQVQALGEAVLTVMRNATHQPASGQEAPTDKGFAPHQFFADGGTVKDEEQQRLANQTAMYVRGAQEAAANRPPAPPDAAASQVQNKAPARTAAPFATTAPTSAGFMPGARAVFNESGKAIGDLANQGRYAAAAGETARAALAYVPAVVDDVVGGAVRAVGPALADAGKQFLGMNEATAPAPAPVPAAAAQNPSPAAPTGTTQAPTLAQQPSRNSPVGMSVADAQKQGLVGERVGYDPAYDQRLTGAPGQNGAVTRNGNSYAGTNVSGDITVNGQAPGGGAVSAQNMVAADALQARQTPAGFQPAGSQPAGVQAPVVRNSTNDWAARNNLRNLEVSASSITNQPGFSRGGRGYVPPDVAAYQAALQTDAALQQAQPGMDQTAMRENAGIQREGMQQDGATMRTSMQEQGATAREAGRTALAGEEMGLKRTAAGFQTRALQRVENLQTRYEAEKDPAKRSELARQLREIQGKEQPSEWGIQVTPATKNADGSTTEGSVIRYNKATGQAERVDTGANRNSAPYPDGTRLNGKDGKAYVVRNGVPVPA
ncbi:hypothetical protein IHV84_02620 [Acidovorax sp. IB03]|uniref:hypothetical protein n=1 Tax=Acidovorax sp. IB03 TaxID=2779366 RepID=UPI0018E829E6|nr:hypothetical protein [Acidovorax sp. IB03]MBJ2162867.1 hypothetical protein [Acidovorax sp. IB03]